MYSRYHYSWSSVCRCGTCVHASALSHWRIKQKKKKKPKTRRNFFVEKQDYQNKFNQFGGITIDLVSNLICFEKEGWNVFRLNTKHFLIHIFSFPISLAEKIETVTSAELILRLFNPFSQYHKYYRTNLICMKQ